VDGALDGVAVVVHDDDHRRDPLAQHRRELGGGHLVAGYAEDTVDAQLRQPVDEVVGDGVSAHGRQAPLTTGRGP
jgi:hypothetical protein